MYVGLETNLQIHEFDILCLTETKLDESVYSVTRLYREKRLSPSGGIAIGINTYKEYSAMTFNFKHRPGYMSWFGLHQEMTGLSENLTEHLPPP